MKQAPSDLFATIRPGSSVTFRKPCGKSIDWNTGKTRQDYIEAKGRAVMHGGRAGNHWVLNCGGRFGTPGIVTPETVLAVRQSRTA